MTPLYSRGLAGQAGFFRGRALDSAREETAVAEILLVGADRERAGGLRALLRQDGHTVTWLRHTDRWREGERQARAELVVAATATMEPILAGAAGAARGFAPPLLFVQHDTDLAREVHLDDRVVDRITSPFMAEDFLARVDALVRLRRIVARGAAASRTARGRRAGGLGERVRAWRRRLGGAMGRRLPPYPRPHGPYFEVASLAAEWSDRRDTFEPGHAERVSAFSAMIADGLGVPDSEASTLLRAAMLHDVGKISMPVEVLRKPGKLADEQLRLLRTHPERGAALLRVLDPDEDVTEAVLLHHERVDGSGYYARRWADVPRTARILAVAEAYDAMTTTQVRERVTPDSALAILRDRQEHFDADCVGALASALRPRPFAMPVSSARWP